MSSRTVLITQAIVDALNGVTWSAAFTAARTYGDHFSVPELKAAGAIKVLVAPRTREREYLDRSQERLDYEIDIGFFRHAPGDAAARLATGDGLVELVEEIEDWWMQRQITVEGSKLTIIGSATAPVFDVELVRDAGVFASVLTLTLMEAA